MNKTMNFIIIGFWAVFAVFGCSDNKALFDELSDNRLKVIVKGTYESNGTPIEFNTRALSLNPLITSLPGVVYDDSIYLLNSDDEPNTTDDYRVKYPTRFMIDISHMKLNQDEFASKRQTKKFSINNDDPFFNGTGIQLSSGDPRHLHSYSSLRIYTRKMIFNEAREYEFGPSGWDKSSEDDFPNGLFKVNFNEKKTQGYDFNLLQLRSYYDILKKNRSDINRVYPVSVPIIGDFTYNRNHDSMVLEVRIMIKNFIKKYETTTSRDSVTRVVHFWGFSDWLRDAKKGEYDMGRNLVAVARCYVPDKVGSITGTNSTGRAIYVIAIPSGDPITRYTLVNPTGMTDTGNISSAPSDDIYTIDPDTYDFSSATTDPGYIAREGDIILINGVKEYIVEVTPTSISFFSQAVLSGSYSFTVYPASDRSQNPCDLPVEPKRAGKGIFQYLDYFQNLEEYRSDFNDSYASCDNASYETPFEYYKEAWLNYEDSVTSFFLPPLAVYVPIGGSFTIENVMPGEYDIYATNSSVDLTDDARYGKLFYSNEYYKVNSVPVPVNTGTPSPVGAVTTP